MAIKLELLPDKGQEMILVSAKSAHYDFRSVAEISVNGKPVAFETEEAIPSAQNH